METQLNFFDKVQHRLAERGGVLNFVFILADELGWRDLGCQGSQFFLSPHIDKLAKKAAHSTFRRATWQRR